MNLDAHQHFWRYSSATHGWIGDDMAALRRDFMPEDLRPLLHRSGLDGCIAVQAVQDVHETAWLLDLADRHAFIRGVVGWVDLRAPGLDAVLERLGRRPRLRGIRHVAQSEPDDAFLARPDVVAGIGRLGRFDLTYDILVYARQLPAAIKLVRRLPDQRFVLDHVGKPDIRSGRLEPWATDIRELARSPNVFCKLSGMVTEADWRRWLPAHFRPYVDVVLQAFGPRRTMFGSDWPVCLLAADYGRVRSLVVDAVADLSAGERAAVMGDSCRLAYGI